MRRTFGALLPALVLGPACECQPEPGPPKHEEPCVAWRGDDQSVTADANQLASPFAEEGIVKIELCTTEQSFEELEAETREVFEAATAGVRSKVWAPVRLRYNGQIVGTVGLRFKGRDTLLSCFAYDDGRCSKLSMRLNMHRYESDLRLAGIKRLNLHAMQHDPTLMRETLAYAALRKAGRPAPRSGYAEVWVDGEPLGLFATVEQIDGRFTERIYPEDGDGHLYKEFWPRPVDEAVLDETLRTHEDAPDHSRMVELLEELAKATTADDKEAIDRAVEAAYGLDEGLAILAAEMGVAHWDGALGWFRYPSSEHDPFLNQNFYTYVFDQPKGPGLSFIHWDMDESLAIKTPYDRLPPWFADPENLDCERIDMGYAGVEQRPAACDPIIAALARHLQHEPQTFEQTLTAVRAYFAPSRIESKIDALKNRIEDAVANDPTQLADSRPWKQAVEELRWQLAQHHAALGYALEQTSPPALYLEDHGVHDWQHLDDLAVARGPLLNASPRTRMSVRPMPAENALAINFTFHEYAMSDPENQGYWANTTLEFTGGLARPSDLRDLDRIETKITTEHPDREIRISLTSPCYRSYHDAIFGWQIASPKAGETVQLRLEDIQRFDGGDLSISQDYLFGVLGHLSGLRISSNPLTVEDKSQTLPQGPENVAITFGAPTIIGGRSYLEEWTCPGLDTDSELDDEE